MMRSPKTSLNEFSGRRVFITGDTGFKGSWLALWLTELGAEVCGFALPPYTDQDHYVVTRLAQRYRHVDGDIRDLNVMQSLMQSFAPEFVFHLAAQPLVRLSYQDPKGTFDTNVAGSVNLLEAVRATASVRALIYVTSDKCYENREWVWGYRENDRLGGRDPYSASKAAAEIVFNAYQASFFPHREGFAAASVRAGNVIGGGDWAGDRIIPDAMRALQSGQPIRLRNPLATRPWQHVLEPVYGYLLLALLLTNYGSHYSGAWNFGPDEQAMRTVGELAQQVIGRWGGGAVMHESEAGAPHEARLLHLNCDKARAQLGWQPRWNFAQTIASTVDWYKAVHAGQDPVAESCAQIRQFMDSEGGQS